MHRIDVEIADALTRSPLPRGYRLVGVRSRRSDAGQWRATVTLATPDEVTLVFDATIESPALRAPFEAPPWHLSYRKTPLEFAAFADLGFAVASRLASLVPSPSWDDAADSEHASRGPARRATWFIRESDLLSALPRSDDAERVEAFESLARPHAAAPAPIDLLLYLSGRCQQRCVFCTVPHERDAGMTNEAPSAERLVADGCFELVLRQLARRAGSCITLLGDDWSAHRELAAMLDTLARHTDVSVNLLGPGTAFQDAALAARVARIASLESVTVTLAAAPDTEAGRSTHDAVAGLAGAAAAVARGIDHLRGRGVAVKIASVITSASVDSLPALAEYCRRRRLPLSVTGFVPDKSTAPTWDAARHIARMDRTQDALALALVSGGTAIEQVVGLPACGLPMVLRGASSSTWASADAEGWSKPLEGPCGRCTAATTCIGVPTAYLRAHGTDGLVAVS